MIDAFEFGQFIGDIQVEDAVDVAGAASGQAAGVDLLFIDDVAKGEIVVGGVVGGLVALAAFG